MVCVHGALDRGASFTRLRRRLRDHTVVTYDRRGYAASIDAPPAHGVTRHAADLAAIADGERIVVVGHSYGGVVALCFAAEYSDLTRSLLVFEPPLAWLPWWSGLSRAITATSPSVEEAAVAAEQFFRRVVGDEAWDRLDDRTKALRRREGFALISDLNDSRRSRPFDPSTIVSPVIVARGEHALDRHVRGCSELASWLDEADPSVVSGAGHGAHLSHPDSFAALVEEAIAYGS